MLVNSSFMDLSDRYPYVETPLKGDVAVTHDVRGNHEVHNETVRGENTRGGVATPRRKFLKKGLADGVSVAALSHVPVQRKAFAEFAGVIGESRTEQLTSAAEEARRLLNGRRFWHVNSTATGGGVAEMLLPLLGYAKHLGIDARWLVVHGTPPFFSVTKRLHNALHGNAGDGESLGSQEAETYEQTLVRAAAELRSTVRPGEPVILHDPQTAGLAETLHSLGAVVIWRCHVGTEEQNEHTEAAWAFLRPYLESHVDHYVFTRETYAPGWIDRGMLTVIPPSIDPISPKNVLRDDDEISSLLLGTGIAVDGASSASAEFRRADGSTSPVTAHIDLNGTPPLPFHNPYVVQVSRWDRLKDMSGVLKAFADGRITDDAHLVLAGPSVKGVSDDPEGASVLADCIALLRSMPESVKQRVTLATVPMDDIEENAAIINALQRSATIVTQKSLAEGFGLTVTEAMYKKRAIVASKVGGIPDQVSDGHEAVLIDDPTDLGKFANAIRVLLSDAETRDSLGARAERRAISRFLMDRHLMQYFELLGRY